MRTWARVPTVLLAALLLVPLVGLVPAGAAGPGTPWTVGSNSFGELGDGTTTRRTLPITVPGLSGVDTVAAGRSYSAALVGP